ncbi:hypothetical protein Tco_0439867 [Tanacetum coccineum]
MQRTIISIDPPYVRVENMFLKEVKGDFISGPISLKKMISPSGVIVASFSCPATLVSSRHRVFRSKEFNRNVQKHVMMQNLKQSPDAGFKPSGEEEKIDTEDPRNENEALGKDSKVPSTKEPREDQRVNQELDAKVNVVDPKTSIKLPNDPNMPELEDIVNSDDDEDVGAETDMNNLDAFMPVNLIQLQEYTKIIQLTKSLET